MYILYLCAAAPDMVGNVIFDFTTVTVVNDDDGDNDDVSLTLSWDEPFANFDPIVSYTVTISCTDNATCPAMFTVNTTSVLVHFITNLSVMTTLSVTATNTVGESEPGMIIIIGMYAHKLHNYVCLSIICYIYVCIYVCLLYAN